MKYHKKTILSPAEFFPLFYQNLRHRKKTFFFSNFCVSKELLQYFTCIPFDLNLDIEMCLDRFQSQIYRGIYQHEKMDFLSKKCDFNNKGVNVTAINPYCTPCPTVPPAPLFLNYPVQN